MEKQPKTSTQVPNTVQKEVKSVPTEYYSLHPSWRIARLEMCDPFGWHKLDRDKLDKIRDRLANLESQTWREILLTGKKFNHSIEKSKLCKKAQDRLTELEQDDIDEVISLRLQQKERIFGIMHSGVLTLLWWDPEHEICPSVQKGT